MRTIYYFTVFAALSIASVARAADDECGCYNNAITGDAAAVVVPKIPLRLNLRPGQKFQYRADVLQRTTTVTKKSRTAWGYMLSLAAQVEVLSAGAGDGAGTASAAEPESRPTIRYIFGDATISPQATEGAQPEPFMPELLKDLTAVLTALRGKSLTVELPSQGAGAATEATDKTKLADTLAAALPRKNAEERTRIRAAIGMLMQQLTAQRDGVLQFSTALPSTAIGVNDTWRDSYSETAFFPFNVDMTYAAVRREGGAMATAVAGKIFTPKTPAEKAAEARGVWTGVDVSGTVKGTLMVDEADGWTRMGSLTRQFVTRTYPGNAGMPDPAYNSTSYMLERKTFSLQPAP